jgi:hypothetical protein
MPPAPPLRLALSLSYVVSGFLSALSSGNLGFMLTPTPGRPVLLGLLNPTFFRSCYPARDRIRDQRHRRLVHTVAGAAVAAHGAAPVQHHPCS